MSDRTAEIMRRGAVANRVLERRYDRCGVVAEYRPRERGMVAPRPLAAPGGEQSGEPSALIRTSSASSCTSTRSTSSWTMRDCSAQTARSRPWRDLP
jgi:hypothetical protein